MELVFNFLVGLVGLLCIICIPYIIGNALINDEDKTKGDYWGLGFGIIWFSFIIFIFIYQTGKGIIYLLNQ